MPYPATIIIGSGSTSKDFGWAIRLPASHTRTPVTNQMIMRVRRAPRASARWYPKLKPLRALFDPILTKIKVMLALFLSKWSRIIIFQHLRQSEAAHGVLRPKLALKADPMGNTKLPTSVNIQLTIFKQPQLFLLSRF